ncbi:MAG: HDOD domain-containing protein [Arcobacter sp.]|uniref:HDOD domain-containing protein n=1 Tax=uncultured Arcobacter sp. TaxID=165434 RepID=UPI000CA755C1|nr:HDOD domain-containing protein [uncultured Arcobacter sp.]PLY10905.1 MAG: HDOD domain-containing protein [Arcobacter sp.]
MKNDIIEKIESLPPLPNSVIELENFRRRPDKEPIELLKIIEQDPLIITTLLRVANSAMFGFRSEVETPSRAVNLLGINFTISIALGSVVQDLIKSNLSAYSISTDDFLMASNLASNIINNWVGEIDFGLKEELLLPAFLQETGKFIISELIQEQSKVEEFQQALKEDKLLSEIEEEFTGFSCSRITANIFKHWNLSHNLIFTIGFVGKIDQCPEEYQRRVKILEVVKILTDIREPLGDACVERALALAGKYGLEVEPLVNAIDRIKVKIEEE